MWKQLTNSKKKKKKSKSKFFTFLFEGINSFCLFVCFYNLPFALIHYTFYFNSISMGFFWIFSSFSMRLSGSLFKISCEFSNMRFFDFNYWYLPLKPRLFSSLYQKLLSLFFLQGQFIFYCKLCELNFSTPWLLQLTAGVNHLKLSD